MLGRRLMMFAAKGLLECMSLSVPNHAEYHAHEIFKDKRFAGASSVRWRLTRCHCEGVDAQAAQLLHHELRPQRVHVGGLRQGTARLQQQTILPHLQLQLLPDSRQGREAEAASKGL